MGVLNECVLHSCVKDPCLRLMGIGTAFLQSQALSDGKAFLGSKYKCCQYGQVGVFRNKWLVYVRTSKCSFLHVCSWRLFCYRSLLLRAADSSPSATITTVLRFQLQWLVWLPHSTQHTNPSLSVHVSVLSSFPWSL